MVLRKDIQSLKQQLADALGENGKDYWLKLKDFLAFKCSKQELESVALSLFTTPIQGMKLNIFIQLKCIIDF
jgi:hypothetical protein